MKLFGRTVASLTAKSLQKLFGISLNKANAGFEEAREQDPNADMDRRQE